MSVVAVRARGFECPWFQRFCPPAVFGPSRESGGCSSLSNNLPVNTVVACVGGDGAGPSYDSLSASLSWDPPPVSLRFREPRGGRCGVVSSSLHFVRRRLSRVSHRPLSHSPARVPRGCPLALRRVPGGKTLFLGSPPIFPRLAGPYSAPSNSPELPCKCLWQFTAHAMSVPGQQALAVTPRGPLPPGIGEQGLDLTPHWLFC